MESPWVNGRFTFDMSDHVLFKKDANNYINSVGKQQLNTVGNISYLDIFLSDGNSVEFHYHPNASELIYCVTGALKVGFINPTPNEWQTFMVKPGKVMSIPKGFWHYLIATENDTHVLSGFDTNNLQTVFGSDIFLHTPAEALADVYCLDETSVKETFAPIKDTVTIGPPANCVRKGIIRGAGGESEGMRYGHWGSMNKDKRGHEHREQQAYPQHRMEVRGISGRNEGKQHHQQEPNNRIQEMVMPEYKSTSTENNTRNSETRVMPENRNRQMMMEHRKKQQRTNSLPQQGRQGKWSLSDLAVQ